MDPLELRAKRFYLTPRGRAFRDKVLAVLEGTETKGPTKSVVALAASRAR